MYGEREQVGAESVPTDGVRAESASGPEANTEVTPGTTPEAVGVAAVSSGLVGSELVGAVSSAAHGPAARGASNDGPEGASGHAASGSGSEGGSGDRDGGSGGGAGGRPLAAVALRTAAAGLPHAWRSRTLGRVGSAAVKVVRMDQAPVVEESHATAEALLVLDGTLALEVGGEPVPVRAGELLVVPAHTPHRVCPGSTGTLLIVEAEPSEAPGAAATVESVRQVR